MEKLAFFGASVTKQGKDSGYITQLSEYNEYIIKGFGHGGMHLSNAGICFIDEVIEWQPDVCFLEWFTSATLNESQGLFKYLDTLIYRFTQANVKLILLLLPHGEWTAQRQEMCDQAQKYALSYNIQTISLINAFPNLTDLLRDIVHTNTVGAIAYAEEIIKQYKEIKPQLCNRLPSKSRYLNINKLTPESGVGFKFNNKLEFTLKGEIIAIYMNVGPYSCQVKISPTDRIYTVWDEWCYWERPSMKIPLWSDEYTSYTLTVLDDDFDRSRAKTQLDWKSIKKYVHILDIYYIGELKDMSYTNKVDIPSIKEDSVVLHAEIKKERICFFGASVTQQGHGSGYLDFLPSLVPDMEVARFGYGGMHLYDAGICFMDEALKWKPDICFIQWFSTGNMTDQMTDYLDTIFYRFTQAGCKLVLLFLPRLDWNEEKENMYLKAKQYGTKHGIPSISLLHTFPNLKDLLRDVVHTNVEGGKLYAENIVQEFNKIKNELKMCQDVTPNRYTNIKLLTLDLIVKDKFSFTLKGEIIGFYMNIGPFTSSVLISTEDTKEEYVLWDQWCYYSRDTIRMEIKSEQEKEFTITVQQEDSIDRSSAKTQLDWKSITKYLHLLKVFYIGEFELTP